MKTEEIIKAAQAYYPSGILHEAAKVSGFVRGAKWADKMMLDRACEWLRINYTNYMVYDLHKYVEDVCSFDIFDDLLIEDFRKAMEGGAE